MVPPITQSFRPLLDDNDDYYDTGPLIAEEEPPEHPIPRMQAAFNESIMESTDSPITIADEHPPLQKIDAEARRQQLLELENFSDEYSSRWKAKPGAKFHPLWKLIAQISFGVHLLQQNLAKSDQEVLRILQVHVDEVDGFLEDTTADFDLAVRDVEERVRFLRLPLEYGETFDTMLNDKTFRTAIVDGNDIIERIIDRTTRAMSNSIVDVNKGIDATAELAKFLDRLGPEWTKDDERLLEIYNTMRGNAEGWYRCFIALQDKGAVLEKLLTQLGVLATEMSRRAGTASRRRTMDYSVRSLSKTPSSKATSPKGSPQPGDHRSHRRQTSSMLDKPLPPDPLQKLVSASAAITDRKSSSRSRRGSHPGPSSAEEQYHRGSKRRAQSLNPAPRPQRAANDPHMIADIDRSDSAPAELHGESSPLEPKPLRLAPSAPSSRPPTASPETADQPPSTLGYSRLEQIPMSPASTYSSDLDKHAASACVSRRDSASRLSLGPNGIEPSLSFDESRRPSNAPLTALPALRHDSNAFATGRWLSNGKKSFSSMKGIFNKKRPLKENHMAILV